MPKDKKGPGPLDHEQVPPPDIQKPGGATVEPPLGKLKQVKTYAVRHYDNGSTKIALGFTDGTSRSLKVEKADAARAVLLVDLLRNEKPISWSDNVKALVVGNEPVGEEEGSE
jgi:hypothetical protein